MNRTHPLSPSAVDELVWVRSLSPLLGGETGAEQISFEYCGYEVTATPDEIRVAEVIKG